MFTKYIICLMFVLNSYNNDYYFDRVIGNPLMTNRSFLCINIKSENFSGKVLLNSSDLFYYLKYKWNNDPKIYKSSIIKLINEDDSLNLTPDDMKKLDIIYVPNDPQIEKDSILGRDKFIEKYFEYYTFRENVSQYEAIIAQLFKWRIVCDKNCENGLIGYRLPYIDKNKVIQRVIECMKK